MELLENSFFSCFSEPVARRLATVSTVSAYQDGDLLFNEGDPASGILLVLEGSVLIVKPISGETHVVLTTMKPGDYFGEVGLFDQHRSTGAVCGGATRLAHISRDDVLDVLRTEPLEVTIRFFSRVIGYLRGSNNQLVAEMVRKEKMQFVGEMASSIIHDFKNPMASILLAADTIAMMIKDNSTKQMCELIHLQTNRMVDMAKELLDYSSGRPALQIEAVSLTDLLQQFHRLNSDFIAKRNVQLELRSVDLRVPLDMKRVLRVLQNIVGNAVDALANRSDARVCVRAEQVEGGVCITVEDNGPGIPEAIRDRLFEPFVTHGKAHGTGLGMAIAKTFVEAHGGSMRFHTETGVGTQFYIFFPVAAALAA